MNSPRPEPSYQSDAKEYARFCRIHRIFFVDGIGAWTDALKARGLSEAQIGAKVSSAARFIRFMGDSHQNAAAPRQPGRQAAS